jgi:hypothetical protein
MIMVPTAIQDCAGVEADDVVQNVVEVDINID